MSLQQIIYDLLPVNRIYKCLTYSGIWNVLCLDKYRLVGYRRTVNNIHILKSINAVIVFLRDIGHGVACNINFAGLQTGVYLAGIKDLEVHLANLRCSLPVVFIGYIRNVMVSIIISYHIRTADDIRMIEPVTCSQLAFSNIFNNALWHGMEICCI